MKILIRTVICLFLFYAATAFQSFLPEDDNEELVLTIFLLLTWISILLGFVGIWRPALAVPLLLLMIWQGEFTFVFFGQRLSYTDNLVVSELGLLLIIGMVLLSHREKLTHKYEIRKDFANVSDSVWKMPSPSEIFVLLVVAIHFANYFNSAVKKLGIGPNWWSWTLDSPTQEIMLAAKLQGTLPISHVNWLWTSVYEVINSNLFFFNFMTIFIQFIAVLAVFRIRWMIILTLLYDATHFIIFFVSGIFFWKWIVFNFAIVAALSTMRSKKLTNFLSTILVLLIALGGGVMLVFPSLNSTVSLGWYETSAATFSEIYAVTEDKKRYRIPSNYFLRSSVVIAQDQFENAAKINIGYPVFSQSILHEMVQKADDCTIEPVVIPNEVFLSERDKLANYLIRHQEYILSIVDSNGYFNYDLYPHHIWSNPFEFNEFKQLDKKRITGFEIEFRTVCMDYVDGNIETEELAKDNFYVPFKG